MRRRIIRWGGVAAAVGVVGALVAWWGFNPTVPSFDQIKDASQGSDVLVVDWMRRPLQQVRVDLNARRLDWIPLDKISPALLEFVMRAEDKRFRSHAGVDWLALLSSLRDAAQGRPRGASTITMQLASMFDDDPPRRRRSLLAKWRQMKRARSLERSWSKDQILEAYLNKIAFRGELEGIGAAARGLFGKAPHGLTRLESAALAALIRSPNASLERVKQRAQRLLDLGHGGSESFDGWGERQALAALIESALGRPYRVTALADEAPHLAARVLREGSRSPGRPIVVTLDREVQRAVFESLRRHLLQVQRQNVQDGAVLVVDNPTGHVLAYVGGSGDLSSARYVDGVVARRQAGSALKPFLYSLAFERRLLTAASLLEDSPLELESAGGVYRPQNYDLAFSGWVTARDALASSLNVPAVRVLKVVGVNDFAARLNDLHFRDLLAPEFYGPSLALGSADVTLWDLTNAYRTLANGGRYSPLVLQSSPEGMATRRTDEAVIDPGASYLVSMILSDPASRSRTFGLGSPLSTRFWAAVKTGTSKDMRDNWCVGFSDRYTVGVWVGNFSGKPMWNVSGITGAAPVWAEIMNHLHRERPSSPPSPPTGVIQARVDFQGIAGPSSRREWFIDGTQPLEVRPVGRTSSRDRILSPQPETIFAFDPDIPASRQRLFFRRSGGRVPERLWRLDGRRLAPASADEPYLWDPQGGRHLLELVDEAGHVLDSVHFEVRGL